MYLKRGKNELLMLEVSLIGSESSAALLLRIRKREHSVAYKASESSKDGEAKNIVK